MSDYFICPNCGDEVPIKALACPECGSDDQTGWSDETLYDGMDIPALEVLDKRPSTPLFRKKSFLFVVGVITVLTFLLLYIF